MKPRIVPAGNVARRVAASLVAALAVTVGAGASAATSAPEPDDAADAVLAAVPTVSVSATENLDGTGDSITVTGTGFVPDSPATDGVYPPLIDRFSGVYGVVGKASGEWRPSEGAPDAAIDWATYAWALQTPEYNIVGGASGHAVELSAEGSFTATLEVGDDALADDVTGNWGVYTFAGAGTEYAPFETFTAISFAPRVEVSKTWGIADDATVTVTGRNFLPAGDATTATEPPLLGGFGGAYVAAGKFADDWSYVGGAPPSTRSATDTQWAVNAEDVDAAGGAAAGVVSIDANGNFEAELTFDKAALAATEGNWGIYTYPGGGAMYAPFETHTPVTFMSDNPEFSDVFDERGQLGYTPFTDEIYWLTRTGITTGWDQGDGTALYKPITPVNRDMMAAFLYRFAVYMGFPGAAEYEAPEESFFNDVHPTYVFYKEISWLYENGITTGYLETNGEVTFRPILATNRDMMAAFLYRMAVLGGYPGAAEYQGPATSPFRDIRTSYVFYDEITWLNSVGVSTGWATSKGPEFRPITPTMRDVMAAFLKRFAELDGWG